MFNRDIKVIRESVAAISKNKSIGRDSIYEEIQKLGKLFNSDIKVIRENVATISKNKSIGTGSIYGEIHKLRGTV
jgi:hypothetical protein